MTRRRPAPSGLETVPEAVERTGVARNTLCDWLRTGKIPGAFQTPGGKKRPGDWRFPPTELDRVIAAKIVGRTEPTPKEER